MVVYRGRFENVKIQIKLIWRNFLRGFLDILALVSVFALGVVKTSKTARKEIHREN